MPNVLDVQDPVHVVIVSALAAIPSAVVGVLSGAWLALRRHQRRIDRIERWMETVSQSNLMARVSAQEVIVGTHTHLIEETRAEVGKVEDGCNHCLARRERTEDAIYKILDEIRTRIARIEGYLELKGKA